MSIAPVSRALNYPLPDIEHLNPPDLLREDVFFKKSYNTPHQQILSLKVQFDELLRKMPLPPEDNTLSLSDQDIILPPYSAIDQCDTVLAVYFRLPPLMVGHVLRAVKEHKKDYPQVAISPLRSQKNYQEIIKLLVYGVKMRGKIIHRENPWSQFPLFVEILPQLLQLLKEGFTAAHLVRMCALHQRQGTDNLGDNLRCMQNLGLNEMEQKLFYQKINGYDLPLTPETIPIYLKAPLSLLKLFQIHFTDEEVVAACQQATQHDIHDLQELNKTIHLLIKTGMKPKQFLKPLRW